MIGWIIALAIIAIILIMPFGLRVSYHSGETIVQWVLGCFRFRIYPTKSKKKTKKQKKDTFESHEQAKVKRKFSDYFPLVKLVLEFLADFKHKLRINDLQFKLILGGSDPCDLSVSYGRYWAVLANIMPHLESWFVIKDRNLEIVCDYLADGTRVEASVFMTVSVWSLLRLLFHHGFRVIIEYYKITKNAKEGATL